MRGDPAPSQREAPPDDGQITTEEIKSHDVVQVVALAQSGRRALGRVHAVGNDIPQRNSGRRAYAV